MKTLFLSYELSNDLSGYGGGDRIEIEKSRSMCCGDTSNNTVFKMPTHFGTHIDFPFHFSSEGAKSSSYLSQDFVFEEVELLELDLRERDSKIIEPADLGPTVNTKARLLFIKTFYCEVRDSHLYWENGPGFAPETAAALKKLYPALEAIAFDSISLTNFQNRPLGRVAHKSFLIENNLLIIEDVDLKLISKDTEIKEVIIAPLRMKDCDGAPATIIAKVEK